MIRLAVSREELERRIDAFAPRWRTRTARRTERLRSGEITEIVEDWSEIKPVFMELQGAKCAFCEKEVEAGQTIEIDVEHYRPKKEVDPWPLPPGLAEAGVEPSPQPAVEPGYPLSAYDPHNYLAACKTCNSIYKRNYFPIAGPRATGTDDPARLAEERPYLIHPLSASEDDPETLIEFYGISPRPRHAAGFPRQRALTTIALLGLDDRARRESLLQDRARRIEHLRFALRQRADATDPEDRALAETAVARLTSARRPHANALRCFERLWNADRPAGEALYRDLAAYLNTVSP